MLLLAVLLALVNDTSGSRNGRWRKRRLRGSHRAALDDYSALELDGCGRVFLDGGSNTGESVRAFIKGHFHSCGLRSPSRQYASYWSQLSQAERNAAMQPLKEPASFCVRSFEAAPALLPLLRRQEQDHRAQKYDVRFVEAALGNVTAPDESRRVVRYADNVWGVSASGLRWGDVHVGDKPVARETTSISGQSYDLRGIVARVRSLNASAVVAIKLDIEGSEYWALEPLVADPELLCSVSHASAELHAGRSLPEPSLGRPCRCRTSSSSSTLPPPPASAGWRRATACERTPSSTSRAGSTRRWSGRAAGSRSCGAPFGRAAATSSASSGARPSRRETRRRPSCRRESVHQVCWVLRAVYCFDKHKISLWEIDSNNCNLYEYVV